MTESTETETSEVWEISWTNKAGKPCLLECFDALSAESVISALSHWHASANPGCIKVETFTEDDFRE